MAGPDVKRGKPISGADIVDLAPTILHMLGERVPKVMDGKVLEETLRSPVKVRFEDADGDLPSMGDGDALSADEEAQIEDRLRSLGYL